MKHTQSDVSDELNPYERERLENIRRNQEILAQLKIEPIVPRNLTFSDTRKRRINKSSTSHHAIHDTQEPKRISLRLKGLSPEGTNAKHEHSAKDKESSDYGDRNSMNWQRKEGPLSFAFANQIEEQSGVSFMRKLLSSQNDDNPDKSRVTTESLDEGTLKQEQQDSEFLGNFLSEKYEDQSYFKKISRLHIPENGFEKVTKDRIYSLAFYPSKDKLIACAGDRWGKLGFWDIDVHLTGREANENSSQAVYQMTPHTQAISSITFLEAYRNKLVSCSYDGSIRLMDIESQTFHELFVHPDEMALCSVRSHTDGHCLYYSAKDGTIGRLDLREPSSITTRQESDKHRSYQLHEKRINTIDIHPTRDTWILTSSGDRLACLWDIRNLKKTSSEPLAKMEHGGAITCAHFSPQTGSKIVTSANDNFIRVFSVEADVQHHPFKSIKIHHDNHTGRWITPFKLVFDPKHDDSFIIGNMRRAIDGFSANHAEYTIVLQNEFLTTIPAVNCIHPYRDIWLSGNASGRIYVWR